MKRSSMGVPPNPCTSSTPTRPPRMYWLRSGICPSLPGSRCCDISPPTLGSLFRSGVVSFKCCLVQVLSCSSAVSIKCCLDQVLSRSGAVSYRLVWPSMCYWRVHLFSPVVAFSPRRVHLVPALSHLLCRLIGVGPHQPPSIHQPRCLR